MKSRVKTEESVSSKRSTLPAGAHRDGLDQPAMFPSVGSHVKMEESASNSTNMTTMPVIAQPDGLDQPAVMMSTNVTKDTLLFTITTNTLSATMEIVKIYQGATGASVT